MSYERAHTRGHQLTLTRLHGYRLRLTRHPPAQYLIYWTDDGGSETLWQAQALGSARPEPRRVRRLFFERCVQTPTGHRPTGLRDVWWPGALSQMRQIKSSSGRSRWLALGAHRDPASVPSLPLYVE